MARKKLPKGKYSGVPISPKLQEKIVQTFAMTGNKSETARQCKVSLKTVNKYLAKRQPAEILEARAGAVRQLAGQMHVAAHDIIESIKPEDIESGRIPQHNAEGELTGYKYYGPTLMQKVTSAAILTDKLKVLNEVEAMLQEGQNKGELTVPSDIRALVHGIKGKIRGLSILNVRFAEENPDLSQKIQQKLAEAEAVANAAPADAEVLDFDNPDGVDGG